MLGLIFACSGICHGESAVELARSSVAAVRDDAHKEKVRIVWPTRSVEATPEDGAEVFLIQGYIDYTCTRIFRRGGAWMAQRVKLTRSWFYNQLGETFSAVEFPVPSERFATAWNAAGLIREARAELVNPPPRMEVKEGLWSLGTMSMVFSRSSHEQTSYVRMRGGKLLDGFEWDVCGTSSRDGLRNFDEIQGLAVFNVFAALTSQDAGVTVDLRSWGPFLTDLLRAQGIEIASGAREFRSSTLPIEVSIRLLGQMGWEPALGAINELDEIARKAESGGAGWPEAVLRESRLAREKITLLQRFDSSKARGIILAHSRKLHPEVDLVKWVRAHYFEKDIAGYYAFLAANLGNPETDEAVLAEDVAELVKLYPGRGRELMRGVLRHPSSEVTSAAALALLADNPNETIALDALQRLASEPTASIPPGARWFSHFGRERALDFLYFSRSPVPPGYRWDAARVRRQLAVVGEDGRMVNRLLSALHILEKSEPSKEYKIAAYRRCLQCGSEQGRAAAVEALRELGAAE